MKIAKKTKSTLELPVISGEISKKKHKHSPKDTSVDELADLFKGLWIDCMDIDE